MWSFIATELLTSIEREPEESVVPEMMESFAKVAYFNLCSVRFLFVFDAKPVKTVIKERWLISILSLVSDNNLLVRIQKFEIKTTAYKLYAFFFFSASKFWEWGI